VAQRRLPGFSARALAFASTPLRPIGLPRDAGVVSRALHRTPRISCQCSAAAAAKTSGCCARPRSIDESIARTRLRAWHVMMICRRAWRRTCSGWAAIVSDGGQGAAAARNLADAANALLWRVLETSAFRRTRIVRRGQSTRHNLDLQRLGCAPHSIAAACRRKLARHRRLASEFKMPPSPSAIRADFECAAVVLAGLAGFALDDMTQDDVGA